MTSDQCALCAHYRIGRTCAAFPGGIPAVILTGEVDHREPYPGDHGVRWSPVSARAARLAALEAP